MIKTPENLTINAMEFLRLLKRLEEIKNLDVHLIPIRSGKKTPDTIGSWNEIHITQESALERVNELHSNIGLVAHEFNAETGKDGLCFIDVDLVGGKFNIPQSHIDDLLAMKTLTIKTKSGGLQFYWVNGGITEYLRSRGFSSNPKWSISGATEDSGEIRTSVAYVLAPGSYVSISTDDKKGSISGATGIYTIYADNPIRDLTPENLPKWMVISNAKLGGTLKPSDTKIEEQFVGKPKEKIDEEIGFNPYEIHKLGEGEEITNEKGLTLTKVIETDKEFAEILMSVGEKGSRSERDWFVCRRMRSMGFTPNQVAQALFTYRYYEKTPGAGVHAYVRYISITIRNAFTREITTYDPKQSWYAGYNVSDISKTSATELPENLPDKRFVVLQSPPRTGKTHWSIRQLIKAKTGVYVTNKHEIIKHALKIFETLEKRKTAVYLVGKERACNCNTAQGECGICPKRPAIHPGYDEDNHLRQDVLTVQKLRQTAMDLLVQHRILTPEVLMDNEAICPYYTLLLAEYDADYCFTIPYFLTSDREIKRVKRTNRDLLVIDEDPVVTSFYPKEYEIASYSYGRGNKNFTNVLGGLIPTIDLIENVINEQKRKKQADKEILRMCEILRSIDEKINNVVDTTTVEGKKEFDEWIKKLDISNDYDEIMIQEILKKLKTLEQSMKENAHEIELAPIFTPLLYVADKSFVWIGGSPTKTLYIIPDRHVMYTPPGFYKKVLIIGATQSELYVQDICEDAKDSEIIAIDTFKYADNFLLISLKGATRKEETRMLYSLLFRFANENAASDLISPALCLTSSKKKQQNLMNMLKSKSVASTDQGEQEQILMWLTANINIFYSNSTLSRGLDIPQYQTMFVESVKFAIPYFTAVLEHAQETGNLQMIKKAKAIISKITVDEVTNSVLRHSPTFDDPTESFKKEERVKIIVIRDRDISSILASVRTGMHEAEVNTMENLEFGAKLLLVLPERHSLSAICQTLAEKNASPTVQFFSHHYVVTINRESETLKTIIRPDKMIFKTNLDAIIESESHCFPKNNAVSLVDPKIKTIVEKHPGLKRGQRLSENAIINFISIMLHRKKDLNRVEQTVKDNKPHKDVKGFDPLTIDKGGHTIQRAIPLSGKIKKNLINMVKGELLKEEMDKGKRFYKFFDKIIYGEPKDSRGNEV